MLLLRLAGLVHRHRQLRALGFPVFVLDDEEKIPWILEEVAAWRM